jgi:hypothetical protein
MSSFQETVVLGVGMREALAACQAAAHGSGWTLAPHAAARMVTCRELPHPLAWGSPTTVTMMLTVAGTGQTRIALSGSNLGFGPVQSTHVRNRVRALRREIENAAARPGAGRLDPPPAPDKTTKDAE